MFLLFFQTDCLTVLDRCMGTGATEMTFPAHLKSVRCDADVAYATKFTASILRVSAEQLLTDTSKVKKSEEVRIASRTNLTLKATATHSAWNVALRTTKILFAMLPFPIHSTFFLSRYEIEMKLPDFAFRLSYIVYSSSKNICPVSARF